MIVVGAAAERTRTEIPIDLIATQTRHIATVLAMVETDLRIRGEPEAGVLTVIEAKGKPKPGGRDCRTESEIFTDGDECMAERLRANP